MSVYFSVIALLIVPSLVSIQEWRSPKEFAAQGADVLVQRVVVILTTLMLVLIIGLRGTSVGSDTINYCIKYGNYSINGLNTEILYQALNEVLYKAGVSWQGFLLVTACLTVLPIYHYIKEYSSNPALSLLMYITIGEFTLGMSGIRQSIAISIGLLAFICLEKRYYLRYIILTVTAFFFHNSAIVLLLLFPLSFLKLSHKTIIVFAIVSVLAAMFPSAVSTALLFFSPERYTSSRVYKFQGTYSINPLVVAMNIVLLVFPIISFWDELDECRSRSLSLLIISSFLSLILLVISTQSMYFARLSYYFSFASVVLVPTSISKQSDKRVITLIRLAVITLCTIAFAISTPGDILRVDHYVFFWQ